MTNPAPLPAEAGATDAQWAQRFAELREAEWQTRCQLQLIAAEIIKRFDPNEQKVSLKEWIGLVEVASKFGRLAIEGVDEPPRHDETQQDFLVRLDRALESAWGVKATTNASKAPKGGK